MRILVDARPLCDSAGGGVRRVARALVATYAETYPTDELICVTTGTTKPQLPSELAAAKNISHVHFAIPNKIWSFGALLGPCSLDRLPTRSTGKIDHIFLPNIGFSGTITQPYTLLLHDLAFLIEPHWFPFKQRLWHQAVHARACIRGASHLFAVSETTRADAIRLLNIPPEKITVIPMGSTSLMQCEAKQLSQPATSHRYVLAIGAGNPRKNAATAVEAVRALRAHKDFSDLELVLVGQMNRAPAWIHPISHPSDLELASLYTHASAFLYPSWYEGFGLPLHEAATFGIRCIASTAGALPETAPKGTLFANPAKPHHWTEALKIALNEPKITSKPSILSWEPAAKILHDVLTFSRK